MATEGEYLAEITREMDVRSRAEVFSFLVDGLTPEELTILACESGPCLNSVVDWFLQEGLPWERALKAVPAGEQPVVACISSGEWKRTPTDRIIYAIIHRRLQTEDFWTSHGFLSYEGRLLHGACGREVSLLYPCDCMLSNREYPWIPPSNRPRYSLREVLGEICAERFGRATSSLAKKPLLAIDMMLNYRMPTVWQSEDIAGVDLRCVEPENVPRILVCPRGYSAVGCVNGSEFDERRIPYTVFPTEDPDTFMIWKDGKRMLVHKRLLWLAFAGSRAIAQAVNYNVPYGKPTREEMLSVGFSTEEIRQVEIFTSGRGSGAVHGDQRYYNDLGSDVRSFNNNGDHRLNLIPRETSTDRRIIPPPA